MLGLLPGRQLLPGQARRVDLTQLTAAMSRHGKALTPGTVAAHVASRQLAGRARRRDARTAFEQRLAEVGATWATTSTSTAAKRWDDIWPALRRGGWVARLHAADDDGERLLSQAFAALDALPRPGSRVDRRVLASSITGTPHGLDDGEPVAGLILAMLAAAGAGGPRSRDVWNAAGVDCDDLTGGLVAVGIYPTGWDLPAATAVTLPPRELARCTWPVAPAAGGWVFVTENPSIATAAADLAATGVPVRLLCTFGTPSALEVAAVARLVDAGWQVGVRADFDAAGLAHVTALLQAAPAALPWRMTADDYDAAARGDREVPLGEVPDIAWDADLVEAMRRAGVARFEEALLPQLLGDLRDGGPSAETEGPATERASA